MSKSRAATKINARGQSKVKPAPIRSKRWTLSVLATASMVVTGCAFFSTRNDYGDQRMSENSPFRATVSADQMPMPLPVEIADDIRYISRTGRAPNYEVIAPVQVFAPPQVQYSQNAETAEKAEAMTGRAPAQASSSFPRGGKSENYVVKKGDTLMKIAFEKHGNFYRWREIFNDNRDRIANFNAVPPGTTIVINGIEYVSIQKNGKPYLIRKADTLVKISKKLYDTPVHWRSLWKNNPQLIHNPNKIYAGFQLYYLDQPKAVDAESRVPAGNLPSQKKAQKTVKKTAKTKSIKSPAKSN